MIGQIVLGKYTVTRLLDQGGMSKIYLARQAEPPRDVVVKVLQEQHLAQPKTREHFLREIYITSRFRHPNAVAPIDSSVKEATGPVLVMEYLRGVDLFAILQREGRLPPDRVGRLLAQLCDVLQAAHDAGIVHRDVKPGNLMVLNAGSPVETLKLMDFGLAKMASMLYISPEELIDFNLPPASGTPEYIPPEQVRGTDVDGRGDLYSVGVLLFELLTGRRPFTHPDPTSLLLAHANDRPPSFAEVGITDVPPAIEEVVHGCLAKSPEQRPKSAAELLQRYEQALGRRIIVLRRATTRSGLVPRPAALRADAGNAAASAAAPALPGSTSGIRHRIEAVMPEAMALVKLKGFIYDLGGEVVESVPGMIKVRVPEPKAEKSGGGLFGWKGRGRTATSGGTDIELHMERRDPGQPGKLTITLLIRPGVGLISSEWHARCKRIGRDLQAYLMGR